MKYILQRKNDGLYIVSAELSVEHKAFARRFNSERQAKNYMYRCGLKSRHVNICTIENGAPYTADRNKIIALYRKAETLG